MRYYRTATGFVMTTGNLNGTEIAESEYLAEVQAAEERGAQKDIIIERTRPMTESEVSRLLIAQQINTLSVDDNTALRMTEFYPSWSAGQSYTAGYKVQHGGKLWRCKDPGHTSQVGWEPSAAVSLWEQICETHDGTLDDPIPYDGNMSLENGKYYIQDYTIYICNRDTGIPVYNALADLVGIYVEAV